jgi:hypothetical protein
VVLYGIVQGLVKADSLIELVSVNRFGIPFNIASILFLVIILALIVFGIYFTYRKRLILWNTVLICIAMVLIGYSSYAMIVIRAQANTPLNENNPGNVFSLLSYLDREQYGDRPLFHGQYYNAPILDYEKDGPIYTPVNGKYQEITHDYKLKFDKRFMTFFPRMYSREQGHINVYKRWGKINGILSLSLCRLLPRT